MLQNIWTGLDDDDDDGGGGGGGGVFWGARGQSYSLVTPFLICFV